MPRAVTHPPPLVLGLVALLVVVTGVIGPVGVGSAVTRGCKLVTVQTTNANAGFDTATFGTTARQEWRCTGDPTSNQPTTPPSPLTRSSGGKRGARSGSGTSNSQISAITHGVPTVDARYAACKTLNADLRSGGPGMDANAMKQAIAATCGNAAPAPAVSATNPAPPPTQPPPIPDPQMVAYQAYAHLAVSVPAPHTAPPANTRTFVGFRTWLWIPASSWHLVTNTSTDGPVSTTVTATPVSVAWIMGDGVTEHCAGPGTPFVVGVTDPKVTKPSCSHVYAHDSHNQPGDHYAVTVVVQYAATWTSNVGPSGQFPPVLLTTQIPLRVNQLQAVLD